MRYLLLISLLVALSGCGNIRRMWSGITGDAMPLCYKGVEYVQFPSGSSVAYDKDGKVLKCN